MKVERETKNKGEKQKANNKMVNLIIPIITLNVNKHTK